VSLKILLADDSMTAQNMGKKILADAGYEVVAVSNGAAAVKKLAEFTPDIIIADVYMPGYNGLEICERVKKSPATAGVPVLLSVGKLEPFRPEEGLKVHADGIIIKPFEATDLLAVTAKLAERAGKSNAPVVSAAPVPTVDEEVEEDGEHVESAVATQPTTSVEKSPEVPAFAMEDVAPAAAALPAFAMEEHAPAPSFELEPSAPNFSMDDRRPDYMKEFGLDPHDAPTVEYSIPKPSFYSSASELDEQQDDEPTVTASADTQSLTTEALAPAALNLSINNVSLPEPEPELVAETTSEPAGEDDFEAKLAAAMAEYEAPGATTTEQEPTLAQLETPAAEDAIAFDEPTLTEPEFATELQASNESNAAEGLSEFAEAEPVNAVGTAWTAEEVSLSACERAVNLEEEFRAFAASAAAGSAASAFAAPAVVAPTFVAPSGPMGDTSWDDEVASVVEESRERFFPPTFTERVEAIISESAMRSPAAEEAETQDDLATADLSIDENPNVPSFDNLALAELEIDDAPTASETEEFAAPHAFAASPLADEAAEAEIPELITHDIPGEWTAAPAIQTPQSAETEGAHADDFVLNHNDFVAHEAPFAHAAVEETVAEAAEKASAEVRESVMAQSKAATPAFDEATVAEVVERVMDRMKNDLVSQIAKELAAKLGK